MRSGGGEEGALRPGSLLGTVNLMTFRCQYNQGRTENVGQVWKSCGWNLGRAFPCTDLLGSGSCLSHVLLTKGRCVRGLAPRGLAQNFPEAAAGGFSALLSRGAAELRVGRSKGRGREMTSLAFCSLPNLCNNMGPSKWCFAVTIEVNAWRGTNCAIFSLCIAPPVLGLPKALGR